MISDLRQATDDVGFPIVAWRERRGLHGPEPLQMARIECRILKDPVTGKLLFVKRGSSRRGGVDGRPWEHLIGFEVRHAEELYMSPNERATRDTHLGKSKWGQSMRDTARVVLALFKNDTALHINCADASETDFEELVMTLTSAFVVARRNLIEKCPEDAYHWPLADERLGIMPLVAGDRQSRILDVKASLIVTGLAVVLIALFFWFAGETIGK